jgi:hypothetical protein
MTLPTGLVTDFDFLTGSWHIVNQRLKQRWVGSNDWDEFDALSTCEPRLAGVIDGDRARWQQAFSRNEHDWETNWIMEFTRR